MTQQKITTWLWAGACLAVALGAPVLGVEISSGVLREAMWWTVAALTIAWVLLGEKKPLASIGLVRPDAKTFLFGIAGAVFMMAAVIVIFNVIFPWFGLAINRGAVKQIISAPLWCQTLSFVRAAVVEEVLYRGYIIERVEALTGSKWGAFAVSAAVFTAAHWFRWGGAQLIVAGVGGILLGLLYLWRRDLVSNMIAHFLVDFVSFFAAAGAHPG